jgi:hypothetical protein
VKPEAKTYYELAAATLRFKFPEPGFLDGIRGKTQAIAKMTQVGAAGPCVVGLGACILAGVQACFVWGCGCMCGPVIGLR